MDKINTDDFIGLSEDEAFKLCKSSTYLFRVANRDNQSYMLTRDYRSNRINFTIVNNFVTKATVG